MMDILTCIFMSILMMITYGFTVHGPAGPLVAPLGSSVVLPCYAYELLPVEDLEVEWRRADSETLVHLFLDSESRPEVQQQDYLERAHFFTDQIQHGNFSLRLDNLTAEDEGRYTCTVYSQHDSSETVVQIKHERLRVSGSSQSISAYDGEDVTLNCSVDSHIQLKDIEVSWIRTDGDILVLYFQNNETLPEAANEKYRERAEFFTAEIPKGNFSLRLKSVRTEDKGVYRCQVFAGELSANATAVLEQLGFSSWHIAVLFFCFAAGFGAVILLCSLIYCRSNNTITSNKIWNLQVSLIFCPNICMFIAFVFWGFTEGSLHETVTCCALYILRPVTLIWALTYLKYLQVLLAYDWRIRTHARRIASGTFFGIAVLFCLILSGADICNIMIYMFGAVGLVLLNSAMLAAELILKARNGERVVKDMRVIVFPSESVFFLYCLNLLIHAYDDEKEVTVTEDLPPPPPLDFNEHSHHMYGVDGNQSRLTSIEEHLANLEHQTAKKSLLKKLASRKQGPNESVRDFAFNYRAICLRSKPEMTEEENLLCDDADAKLIHQVAQKAETSPDVKAQLQSLMLEWPKVIMDFIENVTKAYINCGKYMQAKLPLKSKTLQALSSIDPVVRGHSQAVIQLKELAIIMKHLVPTESDPSMEILRYNVDPNLANYEEGDDIVKWWAHVISLGKYPALTQVIRGALSIFHGPLVESSFSLMGDVIDKKSANMRISTFNAVQTVKYTLRSRRRTGITMFKREDVKLTHHQEGSGTKGEKKQKARDLLSKL
ncbi:butyrophilin 2 isoform X2 [Labeo rohita]|uniref:Butyrophilin 2 isoform X2 n=1 Tax=Labeo rohita TaxID=84645 RepID=A0A498M716_LABRO|nr:butyrophilin 2 isoform X2 [Labeo rohita]